MLEPTILGESPIGMAELKEELLKIKKRDKELNFRAAKTLEYLNILTDLNSKKAKELQQKIGALNIPRLKDQHIIKLVDLMPRNLEDVKTILQGYTVSVNQDNLKKIAKTIQDFLEQKS